MVKRIRSKPEPDFVHVVEWMKLSTLWGLGVEVYEVAAIMFHPHDAAARRTFVASASVDMMERLADLTTPRGEVKIAGKPRDLAILPVEELLDRAMPTALRRKGTGEGKGGDDYAGTIVAAEILQRALVLANDGWPETGIEQVLAEQGDAYRREGFIGTGRDKITAIWQEYKASAHLSLAFIELSGKYDLMQDKRGFFEWIGRSADLLRAGCEIGNRHGKPILSQAECWRILMEPSVGG